MPFTVTTSYPMVPGFTGMPVGGGTDRIAVATLKEVHDRIGEALREHGSGGITLVDLMLVGESGGTVGPLSDGTMIEVVASPTDQVMRHDLRIWAISIDTRDSLPETIVEAWVDAYNALHSP